MNKTTTFLTTVFSLLLMLTGCESRIDNDNGKGGAQSGFNGLRVNYTVNPSNANGTTRASVPSVMSEDSVKTMMMFFFEPTDDGLGKFIELYKVPEDSLKLKGQTTGGTIDVEFAAGSKLIKSSSYVILVVANAPDILYDADPVIFTGQTETDFMATQLYMVSGDNDPANPVKPYYSYPYDGAPIEGNLVMSQRIVKPAADETLNVQLTRIMSRFDVSCEYGTYKLETVSVWNAATSTQIWPGSTSFSTTLTKRLYGVDVTTTPEGKVVGGLYALENYVNTPAQDDEVTTCLILGISDGTNPRTYYRVNIVKEGHQYLKRNNVYQVVVSRVRSAGENTEIDALTQADLLLDINVNGWTVDPNGSVQMDDEGNMLAVGSTNVVLPASPAGTHEVLVFSVGDKDLRIRTRSLPPGITAVLEGDKLKIGYDVTTVDRGGYVEIEFGKLTATINITQQVVAAKYLSISPSAPQIVDGDANLILPNPVTVSSSGPWSAHIYNPGFSFVQGGLSATIDTVGVDGDRLNIFTATQNTDVEPRAAFVLFTLDADPEITCTLVLQQRGVGGISLNPLLGKLEFNPDGSVKSTAGFNPAQGFTVVTDQQSNPDWEADISGTDKTAFTLSTPSGTYTNNGLNVTAEQNTTNRVLTATLTVRLKNRPEIFRTVQLSQDPETISINPTTINTVLPIAGGTSQAVTVTSSKPWSASMVVEGGSATLDTIPGQHNSGDTFTVTFSRNTTPNVVPTATVTVGIPGTDVQTQIVVKQAQLAPKQVKLRNHFAGYPNSVSDRIDGVRYVYEYLKNTMYFGTNGTVYTNGTIDISDANNLYTPSISSDINIYWENIAWNGDYVEEGITWKRNNPQAVLVVLPRNNASSASDMLNAVASGYGPVSTPYPIIDEPFSALDAKNWCINHNNRGSKLWAYLQDGPFGKVTDAQLSQIIYKTYWQAYTEQGLTSWPETMIPILMDNGNCSVGIDPTTNIVYMNGQVFNQYVWGRTNTLQDNYFGSDEPRGIFLRNLLAFIVNSAQYGFDFSKQYAN